MSLKHTLARLRREEDGYALVFFALAVVPFLGIAALVTDLPRQQATNTELQWAADAAALAGARMLDGSDGARGRASAEAQATLANAGLPGFSDGATGAVEIAFFSGGRCDAPAASDADAECIQVTTSPNRTRTVFAQVVGLGAEMTTRASATAQSSFVACDVPPLMMCNPAELDIDEAPRRGQQFVLVPENGGPSAPGNFGLLDPPDLTNSGANLTGPLLASAAPEVCYTAGVSVATGQRTNAVRRGINVRFDTYPQGEGLAAGFQHPPAPHIGSFPRDADLTGSLQSTMRGNGVWNRQQYLTTHHPTLDQSQWPANVADFTRYDFYLWELGLLDDPPTSPRLPLRFDRNGNSLGEAAPSNFTPAGPASRRLIYVAVLNCVADNIRGNSVLTAVPRSFMRFFLTEPSSGGEILGEYQGSVQPNDDDGILRHIVQLVR